MIVEQTWRSFCESRGVTAFRTDQGRLQEMLKTWGESQLGWALRCFAADAGLPLLSDFQDWLRRNGEELPSELVCAAYLSNDPAIMDLASMLETLQAAWFPDPTTTERIEELEIALKELLPC